MWQGDVDGHVRSGLVLAHQHQLHGALGAGAEINAPIVIAYPDSPAAEAINDVAEHLVTTKTSLAGKPLGLITN